MSPNCPSGTISYTIVAGDTLYSLARRFNTTVQAILAVNPNINPNFLQIGQIICIPTTSGGACPPNTFPYIIQAGDTFFSLARRFNTTIAAIQAANPGVDPNRLQIGQRICIPGTPSPGPCPAGTFAYTIRAGDTFFSLARRFNTTIAAIQAANPGVDPNRLQIGQRICIPGMPSPGPCPAGSFAYTIRAGDTLYALANRFNTTVNAILALNPGIDPRYLRVGQIICIPTTQPGGCPANTFSYTIQAGDTFFSLARRFNTTVAAIQAANPGVDPNRLQIGQRICIPR